MSYIVGIAGGSGSGKSTLAHALAERLGAQTAAIISHDDYYKHTPGMTSEQRIAYNFDVPEALDNSLLAADLATLRAGKPAEIPHYDFTTQCRVGSRMQDPLPVIIVEGILVMSLPELADQMDLKVFVDVDADIRLARRLQRDCAERGHEVAGAITMYMNNARPAHEKYVQPCIDIADVVITDALDAQAVDSLAATIKAAALADV